MYVFVLLSKVSVSALVQHLSVENLLKVFSTVLLEGKVIFVAQQLGLELHVIDIVSF